jgi:AsmA family protein
MTGQPPSHRILKWSLGTLAALLGLCALLVIALSLVDLKGPLTRYIAKHTGREFKIDGPLEMHLLSMHPTITAERITIGNPSWNPPGQMALIGKLHVEFAGPLFSTPLVLSKVQLTNAEFHLLRDAAGHANWHWKAPGILAGRGLPLIHALSAPNTHLTMDDDRRHLSFDGILSTTNASPTDPLEVTGTGQLNGHDVKLKLKGDPLANIERDKPFAFTLDERSSGSYLTAHGTVTHPFDFRQLEMSFEASGNNLKDTYYLAGVILPNSGEYHVSGKFSRDDLKFRLTDLAARTGDSDMQATIATDLHEDGQAYTNIAIHSKRLKLSDLGARAAGQAPPEEQPKTHLLPTNDINLVGIRRTNNDITFQTEELDVGRFKLAAVKGKMSIQYGLVTVHDVGGKLPDGKVDVHARFDGRNDTPSATLDLTLTDIKLGQLSKKDPAPIDGPLQGHLNLTGRGRSLHDIAAHANGTVSAVLTDGTMRDSFAELTGIDLRGVGLMLTKNKKDTSIRCAAANFQAHRGTLTAQTLVIDTDPIVITGGGTIQLDSETLDLQIHGQPKSLRLFRLKAPIDIHGPLAHPTISLDKEERKLKIVDPGHGKDVDCATLTASASTKTGAPSPP